MLMIWDVVGFDEVADLQKMPKEVITTLKTFCESGTISAWPGGHGGLCQHRPLR
jgi:predicted ATP-dependent Lon-type protease